MARELLRSVDGRKLPNLGEVAVYWPHQDYTDVFDTTGFEFNDEARYGDRDGDEYPELIEHDAEATAFNLLAALQRLSAAALSRDATMGDPIRLIEVRAELSAANDVACIAIAKAIGPARLSDHLSALQLRLSNERARLAAATRPGEIAMRKVPKRFHDELAAWAGNK